MQIALIVGVFVSVVVAFLALYWAYHEFEHVYRTYLWIWRSALEKAQRVYHELTLVGEGDK